MTDRPPAREPRLQGDGQPRIKVPGLAERVWQDTLRRTGWCECPVFGDRQDPDPIHRLREVCL